MMSAPCNAPLLISPDTASPFHNDLRRPRLDLGVPGHRQCNILSFSNTLFHTVSSCTASRCIQFSSQVYALWCPKYCLPRRTSPYSQCYVLLPGARVKTTTFYTQAMVLPLIVGRVTIIVIIICVNVLRFWGQGWFEADLVYFSSDANSMWQTWYLWYQSVLES